MPPRPRRYATLSGAFSIAAVIACLAFDPTETVEFLRARLYDRLLAAVAPARPAQARVFVLDIDPASLEREGPWPWRRERIARLIEAARAAGAAAIGVDILFATPNSQSPAALARKLAETTGDSRALQIGEGLVDETRGSPRRLRPAASRWASRWTLRVGAMPRRRRFLRAPRLTSAAYGAATAASIRSPRWQKSPRSASPRCQAMPTESSGARLCSRRSGAC